MLFGKNRDEERRSKLWRIVVLTSSVVILVVLAYFATKLFEKNPLEGEWTEDEHGYFIEIESEGELIWGGVVDETYIELKLQYAINKGARTITIKSLPDSYQEASESVNEELSPGEISEALDGFTGSFDYSLETDKLTLTEREYGEQFVFTRLND